MNPLKTRRGWKILDFGLAKLVEADQSKPSSDRTTAFLKPQSQSGIIIGTVGYTWPPQSIDSERAE